MAPVKVVQSVTAVQPESEPVRQQIKSMAGFENLDQFMEAAPESTLNTQEEGTGRRKRRTKEEMRAARGLAPELENDPIVTRFNQRASALGGAEVFRTGFKVAGKPLNTDEDQELSDAFYVLSKKANLNIQENWILLGLYLTFMLVRFFIVRTDMGKQLELLFLPKKKEESK